MAKNKLADLRDMLFEQLEKLKNADNPDVEIRRADAMAKVSNQIIGSVKIQLDFVKTLGQEHVPELAQQTSDFFRNEPKRPAPGSVTAKPGLSTGKQLGPQAIAK